MLLSKLIGSNDAITRQGPDPIITNLAGDSRKVKSGGLFVAVTGTNMDGRQFIPSAIQQGAVAVLAVADANLRVPENIALLTVADHDRLQIATSYIAARFYPRQPSTIVAVTGTSGKTSTAQFTRELWSLNNIRAASLGTLGLITPEGERYAGLTTPLALDLHQMLDECAGNAIDHLVMEASSHGLALHRLDQVKLTAAGFTNLSRDHLDFHKTEAAYFAAKARLFEAVLPRGGTAVLNADIPQFAALGDICVDHGHKILSYGRNGRDLKILEHQPHPQGQILQCEILGQRHEILLPVIGEFQLWNALCAAGMALSGGLHEQQIVQALARLSGVPGRLQNVGRTANGATIFVDYAHKPDALENVLRGLRPHVAAHAGARLQVVFGCGGNRDAGKRPIMGEIAQRLADIVYVTDDNPRHEEAAAIRKEVLAGCQPSPNLHEIGNRHEAIAVAINSLKAGDVLIIAGKGHENGQIIGDQTLPFDDAEVAREYLGIKGDRDATTLAS